MGLRARSIESAIISWVFNVFGPSPPDPRSPGYRGEGEKILRIDATFDDETFSSAQRERNGDVALLNHRRPCVIPSGNWIRNLRSNNRNTVSKEDVYQKLPRTPPVLVAGRPAIVARHYQRRQFRGNACIAPFGQ